eukprot:Nitzschia sp. Nitz4//scaffold27_size158506//49548//53105//NITZ4_002594-RA/size158506-processed-gene-0.231-mRNA-1//1//CDS//3329545470//6987//frame0
MFDKSTGLTQTCRGSHKSKTRTIEATHHYFNHKTKKTNMNSTNESEADTNDNDESHSMSVSQRIAEILSQGGLEVPAAEPDLLSMLEAWVGLPEASVSNNSNSNNNSNNLSNNVWETEGMEFMAPFPDSFYTSLHHLLIQIWKPANTIDSPEVVQVNPLMRQEISQVSLYTAMESIRLTRLMRYWMELNVTGRPISNNDNDDGDVDMEEQETSSLSAILLSVATPSETLGSTQHPVFPLLQALYHHLEQLPFLHSQMYAYTQSLRKGSQQNTSSSTAQSRLQQFQQAEQVTAKLNQEWQDHIDSLEFIVGDWYQGGTTDMRRQTRMHLGALWTQFLARSGKAASGGLKLENTSSSAIPITLALLHRIVQGTTVPLQRSHEHLLMTHLIPLHEPSAMVLWRDQTSLLQLYHEPLVQCIAILLQKQPEWIPKVISALLEPDIWDKSGNTPKLILLLHEIDTYLGLLPDPKTNPAVLGPVLPKLLQSVGSCMASDHSQLAERALSFVKTTNFCALVYANFSYALNLLLPFLVKAEPSWNPTVRKMTYRVLHTFQEYDEERFWQAADKCFSGGLGSPPTEHSKPTASKPPSAGTALQEAGTSQPQGPKDFSLKAAMGDWKAPPTGARPGMPRTARPGMTGHPSANTGGGAAPPLTVTGVAPWSMTPPTTTGSARSKRNNPPLGVTGVAPWAAKKKPSLPPTNHAPPSIVEENETSSSSQSGSGRHQVSQYMEKIKPAAEDTGASNWSQAQMAETPTLLPNLKFHDLVFGHDLGTGAFGSVRYARLIDRSKTRSHWDEYAVKVISTEKIKEMGYEASVQREVAVLRVISHPGIARLVSSFRFREGVYLVLEYASKGDLHSLIHKSGSLDHDSTRFVIGEVVAALASIHELGFVYGDLKPENIVISETGHVKLTDFGGCRPVTESAKDLLSAAAKNLLRDLRSGDWKQQGNVSTIGETETDSTGDEEFEDVDVHEDDRVEGTTAYLPPEVVMGNIPTIAADSWALGCVLYQCLTGRPPIIEADETSTRHRIVSFDSSEPRSIETQLFDNSHGANVKQNARNLVLSLLCRMPLERPSMNRVAQHHFFKTEGVDVFSLYRQQAHPLDVGDVSPVADSQWSRRQFSSIWAPQPQTYDISIQPRSRNSTRGRSSRSPISEGDESTTLFSKQVRPQGLRHISEEKFPLPMPPRPSA